MLVAQVSEEKENTANIGFTGLTHTMMHKTKETGARGRLREFKTNIAYLFACIGGTQLL